MITVDRLIIKEFRGIREIDLTLAGKNFAICGPNGTGKSGIVDALEFVLTGTISRLTGRGRGDLSIKEHAPHVDSSKSPEKAIVEAYVAIPSLKQTVHIVRNVKTPKVVKLTPDTPAIRAVLAQVESHPEIALSRREIIRYILAEPGQRANDVQELLRLDIIGTLRSTFQKIANACDATVKQAEGIRVDTGKQLSKALKVWTPDEVFLAGLRRDELLKIGKDCGALRKQPKLADSTKKDLIAGLVAYFKRTANPHAELDENDAKGRTWLPACMVLGSPITAKNEAKAP